MRRVENGGLKSEGKGLAKHCAFDVGLVFKVQVTRKIKFLRLTPSGFFSCGD